MRGQGHEQLYVRGKEVEGVHLVGSARRQCECTIRGCSRAWERSRGREHGLCVCGEKQRECAVCKSANWTLEMIHHPAHGCLDDGPIVHTHAALTIAHGCLDDGPVLTPPGRTLGGRPSSLRRPHHVISTVLPSGRSLVHWRLC